MLAMWFGSHMVILCIKSVLHIHAVTQMLHQIRITRSGNQITMKFHGCLHISAVTAHKVPDLCIPVLLGLLIGGIQNQIVARRLVPQRLHHCPNITLSPRDKILLPNGGIQSVAIEKNGHDADSLFVAEADKAQKLRSAIRFICFIRLIAQSYAHALTPRCLA